MNSIQQKLIMPFIITMIGFLLCPNIVSGQVKEEIKMNDFALSKLVPIKDSVKSLKSSVNSALNVKDKKLFSNLGVDMAQQTIYQQGISDTSRFQGLVNVGLKFQSFGLPIEFNLSSKVLPTFDYNFNRQQLFNFKYSNAFNNLKSNSQLNQVLKSQISSQLDNIKSKVKSELEDVIKDEIESQNSFSIEPSSIKSLLSLKDFELKNQLDILLLKEKKELLDRIPWDEKYNSKKDSIESLSKNYKEKLIGRINQFKSNIEKLGISNIKELIAFSDGRIEAKQMLESLIKSKIENSNGLNFISKVNERLNGFDFGQFSYQMPFNLLNQQQFFNGFQTSVQTRRGPVSIGFFKDNNLVGLNETEFNQNVFSNNRYVGFMKAVVLNGANNKGTFSFAGTTSAYNNNDLNRNNSSPNQSSYALGFEQSIKFKKAGSLRLDFNKSLSRFNNAILTDFQGQFISQNFNQIFDNSFSQSFSGGVTHQLDLDKIGLNSQVYFNYMGNQYINPGNSSNNQPRLRWGGKFKKTLFENKLNFIVRADHRSSVIGDEQGWRNQMLDLEGRFKVAKRTTVSFKFQDNSSQVLALGTEVLRQSNVSKKYQVSGNTGFKVKDIHLNSQFNITRQDFIFYVTSPVQSNNLMFNVNNLLRIGNQSINSSLFINKDRSNTPLIGDMLNSDLSWIYNLSNHLNFSSGLSYLNNKGMAEQLGVKQSIQFVGVKNIDFNMFFDMRKNLVTPSSSYLFGGSRGEISFTYHLNK